jgi:hypothetical protein
MSRAKKVDANQKEIVKTFRDLGAKVYISSGFGDGFTDLVVQYRYPFTRQSTGMARGYETLLVEVKDGVNQPPSKRKLTPDQVVFHSIFHCHIVETVEDVFNLLEVDYEG